MIPIPDNDEEFKAPLVISSIGSLPEIIDGIPVDGQVFKIPDYKTCRIEGFNNVFALGNAVTGRGNIKESMKHGKEISLEVVDFHLDWLEEGFQSYLRSAEGQIDDEVNRIIEMIKEHEPMPDEVIRSILDRTKALQEKVGYDGHFPDWVRKNLPPRLEDMIKEEEGQA